MFVSPEMKTIFNKTAIMRESILLFVFLVVDVKDENQLINAIKTLMDSQSIRLEYGLAARSKIESEYLQEIQIGKVVNLLTTGIKK